MQASRRDLSSAGRLSLSSLIMSRTHDTAPWEGRHNCMLLVVVQLLI
jgi:hypothetical protein